MLTKRRTRGFRRGQSMLRVVRWAMFQTVLSMSEVTSGVCISCWAQGPEGGLRLFTTQVSTQTGPRFFVFRFFYYLPLMCHWCQWLKKPWALIRVFCRLSNYVGYPLCSLLEAQGPGCFLVVLIKASQELRLCCCSSYFSPPFGVGAPQKPQPSFRPYRQ